MVVLLVALMIISVLWITSGFIHGDMMKKAGERVSGIDWIILIYFGPIGILLSILAAVLKIKEENSIE
jgi:membrane protease YdiL (CAAX protease family)